MENTDKSGPEGAWTPPEWAEKGASKIAEASENVARSAGSDAAAALAPRVRLGAGLGSAPPQAPGPSDPKRRSSPDPGDRAEASASDGSGSAAAGAPSPAPPELAGAAVAGTLAKLGPIASVRPSTLMEPPRPEGHPGRGAGRPPLEQSAPRAKAPRAPGPDATPRPPARRGQAAAPSAPALATRIVADGSPASAGGAPPDPERGRHAGVRDGADGRKPEGAAPETRASGATPPALRPSAGRLSGRLAALAETAKAYARAAQSDNTQRAYSADWRQFASWLRRQGLPETPPDPEAVGLYLASQVERGGAEVSVATVERRLSGIAWRYRQLGEPLDIRDRHIATVLAGIRRRHARPPLQKAAIFADELLAMLATLDMASLPGACATGRSWRSDSPAG